MMRPELHSIAASFLVLCCFGCGIRVGGRSREASVPRPEDELKFDVLYRQNCAGCHGANGRNGAAMELANPEYQALVDDASLRKWIGKGMPQTQMPAFAISSGGVLTDKQIDILVQGMRRSWSQPVQVDQPARPSYAEIQAGDPTRGKAAFQTFCGSCHKNSKQEVTSPDYLALMNDQAIRSIVIAGRTDIGQPDWRNDKPGKPMSDQNVSDIVHYLASLRTSTPGQPYAEQWERTE